MTVTHELGDMKSLTVRMLPQLSHLQNYLGMMRTHTWSLAIEEHFYSRCRSRYCGPAEAGPVRSRGASDRSCAGDWLSAWRLYLYFSGSPLQQRPLHVPDPFAGGRSLLSVCCLAFLHHCRASVLEPIIRHRMTCSGRIIAPEPDVRLSKRDLRLCPDGRADRTLLGVWLRTPGVVHTPLGKGWLGSFLNTHPASIVAWIGCFSYSIYLWHLDLGRDRSDG